MAKATTRKTVKTQADRRQTASAPKAMLKPKPKAPSKSKAGAQKRSAASPAAAGPAHAGISDAAVLKATGRSWLDWFAALDQVDFATLGRPGVVAAAAALGATPWWGQMVTVAWEQARGHRVRHQTVTGFSASASRVISAPIEIVYDAWQPPNLGAWLGEAPITVRRATANRSLRLTWGETASSGKPRRTSSGQTGGAQTGGGQSVEIMFYEKGPGKCQVTAQHNRLANAAAVKRMKSFWGKALDALRAAVEGA